MKIAELESYKQNISEDKASTEKTLNLVRKLTTLLWEDYKKILQKPWTYKTARTKKSEITAILSEKVNNYFKPPKSSKSNIQNQINKVVKNTIEFFNPEVLFPEAEIKKEMLNLVKASISHIFNKTPQKTKVISAKYVTLHQNIKEFYYFSFSGETNIYYNCFLISDSDPTLFLKGSKVVNDQIYKLIEKEGPSPINIKILPEKDKYDGVIFAIQDNTI